MKINISGKGMKVGDRLQQRIEEKLGKFNRFFGDDVIANVKVRPEKNQKCIEVTLKIQKHYYRSEAVADDVFTALDQAVDVLEGQNCKQRPGSKNASMIMLISKSILKHSLKVSWTKMNRGLSDANLLTLHRWIRRKPFCRWKCWDTVFFYIWIWKPTRFVWSINAKMAITV